MKANSPQLSPQTERAKVQIKKRLMPFVKSTQKLTPVLNKLMIKRLEVPQTSQKKGSMSQREFMLANLGTPDSVPVGHLRVPSQGDQNYQTLRIKKSGSHLRSLYHSSSTRNLPPVAPPFILTERVQGAATTMKILDDKPQQKLFDQKPPLPEYAHGSELRKFMSQLGIRGSGNESVVTKTSGLNIKKSTPQVQQPQATVPPRSNLKTSIKTNLLNAHLPPQLTQALQSMHQQTQLSKLYGLQHFLSSDNLQFQPKATIKVNLLPKPRPEMKISPILQKKQNFMLTQMQRQSDLKEKFVTLKIPRKVEQRQNQVGSPLDILKEYGTVHQRKKTQQVLNHDRQDFS